MSVLNKKHRDVAWEELEHEEDYPSKTMPLLVTNNNTLIISKGASLASWAGLFPHSASKHSACLDPSSPSHVILTKMFSADPSPSFSVFECVLIC